LKPGLKEENFVDEWLTLIEVFQ